MRAIRLRGGGHAFVDESDWPEVSKYKWSRYKHRLSDTLFYARMRVLVDYTVFDGVKYGGKYKDVFMHRFLLKPEKNQIIDHRNGNGLDNTRDNLRVCSRRENSANSRLSKANSSGYKGVCFYKNDKKWGARIGNPREPGYHLGLYDNPREAAIAYNKAAKKRYGKFAFLNKVC